MPTDAPKRRWLQFRLRTLLALIALTGVGLALIVTPAARQKRAMSFVLRRGGDALYRNTKMSERAPEWLMRLIGPTYFCSECEIDLDGSQVGEAELERLNGLTGVRGLALRSSPISDARLAYLKGLTELEWLCLDDTPIHGEGLAHLKGLTSLKILTLRNTQVSDIGLAHLAHLIGLEQLDLSYTKISDAGLSELRRALPACKIMGPSGRYRDASN